MTNTESYNAGLAHASALLQSHLFDVTDKSTIALVFAARDDIEDAKVVIAE
jgi:hypothetical protein